MSLVFKFQRGLYFFPENQLVTNKIIDYAYHCSIINFVSPFEKPRCLFPSIFYKYLPSVRCTVLFTLPGPALASDWLAAAGAPLGKQLPEAGGAVWLFLPENKAEYEGRLFIQMNGTRFLRVVRCHYSTSLLCVSSIKISTLLHCFPQCSVIFYVRCDCLIY